MITQKMALALRDTRRQELDAEQEELIALTIQMGEFYIRRSCKRGNSRAMVYIPFSCQKRVVDHFVAQGFEMVIKEGNKFVFSWE